MSEKKVYFFSDGQADGQAGMKNLLGGKGANLAEMTRLGVPVPPGFTVDTEACNAYLAAGEQFPAGMWEEVLGAVKAIESIFTEKLGLSPWMILILMQLSFLLMGTFLDDTAMLVIVAPLYVPLVKILGFDPVWYGVLYTITCQIAYMTPPFGYNLFLMRAMAPPEITLGDIYRSILPFVAVMILGLALVMMETLTDFATVQYFGVDTVSVGVFRIWRGTFDRDAASDLPAGGAADLAPVVDMAGNVRPRGNGVDLGALER